MRTYETTFIVNPQTDDATINNQVGAISKLIEDNGGKIINENRMGTRRLAYPIQKLTQGYYTTFVYEGTPKLIPVLDHHFNLGESYLRHMTVLFEGDLEKLKSPHDDDYDREENAKPKHDKPESKPEAAAAPAEAEEEVKAEEPKSENEEPAPEVAEEETPKIEQPEEAKNYNDDDEL